MNKTLVDDMNDVVIIYNTYMLDSGNMYQYNNNLGIISPYVPFYFEEDDLRTISILTLAGALQYHSKWELRNYREDPYPRNASVDLSDPHNGPIVARYIGVYNNGSSGVSLSEFEAFGFGMYSARRLHQKFEDVIDFMSLSGPFSEL